MHDRVVFSSFVTKANNHIDLKCEWSGKVGSNTLDEFEVSLVDGVVYEADRKKYHDELTARMNAHRSETIATDPSESEKADALLEELDSDIAASLIYNPLPGSTLFDAATGLLPNTIDIDKSKGKPIGAGARAAQNFLTLAEIDLPQLLQGDTRTRQNILSRANKRVSEDF